MFTSRSGLALARRFRPVLVGRPRVVLINGPERSIGRGRGWTRRSVLPCALGSLQLSQTPAVAHPAQTFGVPACQAPETVPFMIAAEPLTRRRMGTGRFPIPHAGQFRTSEQLKLPHK